MPWCRMPPYSRCGAWRRSAPHNRRDHRRANVDGTRNVFDALTAGGVRRVVHVSSVAIYAAADGEHRRGSGAALRAHTADAVQRLRGLQGSLRATRLAPRPRARPGADDGAPLCDLRRLRSQLHAHPRAPAEPAGDRRPGRPSPSPRLRRRRRRGDRAGARKHRRGRPRLQHDWRRRDLPRRHPRLGGGRRKEGGWSRFRFPPPSASPSITDAPPAIWAGTTGRWSKASATRSPERRRRGEPPARHQWSASRNRS